ncbi:hypothetical protein CDV36_005214 [Fusarium kuroshium]|uniref:Uncharacterized protein n=1 Tax=Fusarium kuroshium TaxID=2010991 RepID=A0A3M2SCZ5_9HYPO|nr:hypothetical protein CDV36_005214 [Fusarium kuroshium]
MRERGIKGQRPPDQRSDRNWLSRPLFLFPQPGIGACGDYFFICCPEDTRQGRHGVERRSCERQSRSFSPCNRVAT